MTRPGRYPPGAAAAGGPHGVRAPGRASSQWAAICSIAHKFGVSSETLRKWVRRAETNDGLRPGLTGDERGVGVDLADHPVQGPVSVTASKSQGRLSRRRPCFHRTLRSGRLSISCQSCRPSVTLSISAGPSGRLRLARFWPRFRLVIPRRKLGAGLARGRLRR